MDFYYVHLSSIRTRAMDFVYAGCCLFDQVAINRRDEA